MNKQTFTLGSPFHTLPGFEENLKRSEKLLMFGHRVTTLSREELLACIVHVQDYADQQDKKIEELEKQITLHHLSHGRG